MEVHTISDEEALGKCAWCRNQISDGVEVFGVGAKIRPGVDLSDYEGEAIQLMIVSEDRFVPMMLTLEGSEAKNDGNDIMFLVCSETCGKQLKSALERDKSLGDVFEGIQQI